jgi:hypothetical protein
VAAPDHHGTDDEFAEGGEVAAEGGEVGWVTEGETDVAAGRC